MAGASKLTTITTRHREPPYELHPLPLSPSVLSAQPWPSLSGQPQHRGGRRLLFSLSLYFLFFLYFSVQSSLFLVSVFGDWVFKGGIFIGHGGMAERCLCFDLGYGVCFEWLLSGLSFEDISRWVYWAECGRSVALEILFRSLRNLNQTKFN